MLESWVISHNTDMSWLQPGIGPEIEEYNANIQTATVA